MRRLRAYVSTVWSTLSRVGVDPHPTEEARAVAAGNRFYILAVAASLPWVIVLAVIGGPEPAPAASHAVMVLAWAAGLWFNRLGMSLLAATLALIAPLMQYAYLTDVYSRGAAFHLHLLAIPALCFALFPSRRWALRLSIGILAAAVLVAVFVLPTFDSPRDGYAIENVRLLASFNVVSVLVLLYTIAAFNNFYYQRERTRNAILLTEAQAAAQTDSLTESLNRRGIAPVIQHASRTGQYALALVDLDRFKRINDALGHGAGDVVLANVARSIARAVGDKGTVARWGGEEFLIVLPKVSLERALAIIEHVRAEVEDEYAMDGVAERVTISAGVAHGRQYAPRDELLRLADAKLYEAKASGRNLVLGAAIGASHHD